MKRFPKLRAALLVFVPLLLAFAIFDILITLTCSFCSAWLNQNGAGGVRRTRRAQHAEDPWGDGYRKPLRDGWVRYLEEKYAG